MTWLSEWPTDGMREAGEAEYWDLRATGFAVAVTPRSLCLGCGKTPAPVIPYDAKSDDVRYCSEACYRRHQ